MTGRVRTGVTVARLEHLFVRRTPREAIEGLVTLDLERLDGQVRPALILDDDGSVAADLHVAGDGDAFILIGEGRAPEASDLRQTHAFYSLNGPFAWELLARLEGPEVLGLGLHTHYAPRAGWHLLRLARTGEYGYDLLVPHDDAAAFEARLRDAGRAFDLEDLSRDALDHAALEDGIFVLRREGRAPGLTPVELQLQWRLSPAKPYRGRDAVLERRRQPRQRIVGFRGGAAPASPVLLGEQPIGAVLVAEHPIRPALLDRPYAHAQIARYTAGGAAIRTVSRPFVENLSLTLHPDRDTYRPRV